MRRCHIQICGEARKSGTVLFHARSGRGGNELGALHPSQIGKVEQDISWEPVEGDDEDSDLDELDVEEADVISAFLIWEEGGDRELVVDLGISDNGTYLQVNNVDIRPEREALEQALLEGFRDELDV